MLSFRLNLSIRIEELWECERRQGAHTNITLDLANPLLRPSCALQTDMWDGHSLIVSLAQEEEQPPRLHCGQDEGRYPDKSDEAAGGLGPPLLNDEALLGHSYVLILPHSPRKQKTFPPEILRVFRQRHHGNKTKYEG